MGVLGGDGNMIGTTVYNSIESPTAKIPTLMYNNVNLI